MKDNLLKKRFQDMQWLETNKLRVLDYYKDHTIPETAERFDCSVTTTTSFLRQHKVIRSAGSRVGSRCTTLVKLVDGKRELLIDRLKNMTEENFLSNCALAKEFGISRERVRQIRNEVGLPSVRGLQKKVTLEKRADSILANEVKLAAERIAAYDRAIAVHNDWLAGMPVIEMAKKHGKTVGGMFASIHDWRERYPELFPYRHVYKKSVV